MLINVTLFIALCIGHDATRNGSGNLTYQDFLTLRRFNHDGGTLVFGAGLWKPGFVEIAVVVLHFLDNAFNGIPVGMHVGDGHEDGNHDAAVVEILVFVHFLNHYDFSVGRSHCYIFGFSVEDTDGTSEEIDHNGI